LEFTLSDQWFVVFASRKLGLGIVLAALGRREEAIAEYKTAIALDPNLVAPISLGK
jgi:Flp pilus assembly protein TadD